MLEGYEISYHPIGDEDPNDRTSEAYQLKAWQETRVSGSYNAIAHHHVLELANGGYLVIVRGRTEAARIIRAPSQKDFPPQVWQDAVVEMMHEMRREYPYPEYTRAFGGFCLIDAMRAFPLVRNYSEVPLEKMVLSPKQPSTPGVSS